MRQRYFFVKKAVSMVIAAKAGKGASNQNETMRCLVDVFSEKLAQGDDIDEIEKIIQGGA